MTTVLRAGKDDICVLNHGSKYMKRKCYLSFLTNKVRNKETNE